MDRACDATADRAPRAGTMRRVRGAEMRLHAARVGGSAGAGEELAQVWLGRRFPFQSRSPNTTMLLALPTYLIREHAGVFKLTATYDIFDGATGEQLAVAKEKKGTLNAIAGLFIAKRNLPTRVDVHEGKDITGPIVFSLTCGFSFFRPTVKVLAGDGTLIGTFKSRLMTLGGKFGVYDVADKEVAVVQGNWTGWNFRFVTSGGDELGVVSKKWAGVAKELFTSADNYVVAVHHPDSAAATLLLAAGLAIDTVYKEGGGGGGAALDIGE